MWTGEELSKRRGFRQRGWSMQISNKFPCFIPGFHTPVAPFRDSVPFPPLCLVAGTEGGFHGDRFPIPQELQGEGGVNYVTNRHPRRSFRICLSFCLHLWSSIDSQCTLAVQVVVLLVSRVLRVVDESIRSLNKEIILLTNNRNKKSNAVSRW